MIQQQSKANAFGSSVFVYRIMELIEEKKWIAFMNLSPQFTCSKSFFCLSCSNEIYEWNKKLWRVLKTHTRTFALPKSQSLTWWVRGSTYRKNIYWVQKIKKTYSFRKNRWWISYQKILRLHIPMAHSRNRVDICQPPKNLESIFHLLSGFIEGKKGENLETN